MNEPRPPAPRDTDADTVSALALAGRQVIVRLSGLIRASRLYDLSNQLVQRHIAELLTVLSETQEAECILLAIGEHFYMNGERIRPNLIQMSHLGTLTSELRSRGLGGLRFLQGLTADEVAAFVRLFLASRDQFQGSALLEAVAEAGILHLIPIREDDISALQATGGEVEDESDRSEMARARRIFSGAICGTRSMWESMARTGRPPIRQARRIVQPLIDTLMKNEYSILGLAALKDHDEYTYSHCVNVSMISIGIGQRLGMDRCSLASLGVAALLHDVGKLIVPNEILRKSGKLTPEEWGYVEKHPLEGVRMVSRLPSFSDTSLYTMWVCLQHHLSMDGRGYPRIEGKWTLRPIARIVAAADCYDAMTGHRAYRARPMTGHEALQQMMGPEAERFDGAVMLGLISCVGVYPAGSVLQTESGFTALSVSPNPADPRRPNCQILTRPDGEPPSTSEVATWHPMPAEEKVARVIAPGNDSIDIEARLAA